MPHSTLIRCHCMNSKSVKPLMLHTHGCPPCCAITNLHAEHHLFPAIRWHHLPAVRQALSQIGVSNYIDVPFPGFNNALRKEDPVGVLLNRLSPRL